ncbi:MAG: hypothetical protein ACP5VS_14225 [Desulfomonilaceae bacterium]
MTNRIKRLLANYLTRIANIATRGLLADPNCSPGVKITQRHLMELWKDAAESGKIPSVFDTGFRIYSQFEEDGILLFLFSALGEKNRIFIDIGSADGVNSNCANLAINFGWHGLFVDRNPANIARGQEHYAAHPDTFLFPPKFACHMITSENINEIILSYGFKGEIDLLSIDVDGNDYWIWDAIEVIQPRVVIIETHIEFGYHNIVVPYDPNYVYPGCHPDYHGTSPAAMVKLAEKKGIDWLVLTNLVSTPFTQTN